MSVLTNDRRLRGIIAVLAGVLCFSSSSSLVKWSDTNGAAVAFWRLLLSALTWWVIVGVRRARTGQPAPDRATWRMMIPVAVFFGLNITMFFYAIQQTSIAHAEFIAALSPLLLVPAGALLFGERPDGRALWWGLVTVAGLAVVLFSGRDGSSATLRGDLMIASVVVLWVGYLLTARRARATVGLIDFMAILMNLAFLVAMPFTAILAGGELWSMGAKGWVVAVILSLLTGVLAHGLIAFAQKGVDVGTIGILQVSQPAIAVGWALLILGEAVAPMQIAGMVLVVTGLVAFTVISQRRATLVVTNRDGELLRG